MIHHLEIFPTSVLRARTQLFTEETSKTDTLIIANPMTRPPPMCLGKKKPLPREPRNETLLQAYHVR